MVKIQVEDTRIARLRVDDEPIEDGWIEVNDYPKDFMFDSANWYYINGEFVKESEEDIRRREEEERREAERNAPILLQMQYITREDFDLLDAQDDRTMYYIIEEDGSTTMQKGVN